jgi:hypothetical protein
MEPEKHMSKFNTTTEDRLVHIMADNRTAEIINGAMFATNTAGVAPIRAMTHMAETLCGLHGMTASVYNNAVLIWPSSSRAVRPACILISADRGQAASPSCRAFRRTGQALIQVFYGGADDTDMAADSPATQDRIEAESRVLFH